MSSRESIDKIIQEVQSWPAADRAALAYEILRELRRQPLQPAPRDTLSKARGLLKTAQPPSDDEVKRWIGEYRMHKYGQR